MKCSIAYLVGTLLLLPVCLRASAPTARAQGNGLDGGALLDAQVADESSAFLQTADAALVPEAALKEPVLMPAPSELAAPPEVLVFDNAPLPDVIDVTVRSESVAQRVEQSAAAVSVVDLTTQRRQSADLGEVLARTQGVSVRRTGGLGSAERIALNGLEGERVRILIDGLPIAASGYGNGMANIPLNLVDRVEIYRGVVPVRFGIDALGGAIHVVTRAPTRGLGGSSSLTLGSFGTTRATVDGHHYETKTGLLTRARAYFDDAKNDYRMRVTAADATGQEQRIEAYRTHDAYRAYGGGIDVGLLRRKWAERLVLKTFAGTYDKEQQSNLVMTRPYGEVRYGGQNYGANLQYVQPLTDALRIDAVFGYSYTRTDYEDLGKFVYDWFGQRVRPTGPGGEIDPGGDNIDQRTHQHGLFGRLNLTWDVAPSQKVHLSIAPSYVMRGAADLTALPGEFDPLDSDRRLLALITGIEHAAVLWKERVDNSLFAKSYFFQSKADEALESKLRRRRDQQMHRFGVGDGVRVHLTEWLYAKASYELATRLPSADEIFGDGRFALESLTLKPERSHNTNLQLTVHDLTSRLGVLMFQAAFFDRRARDLIAPPAIGGGRAVGSFASYQNLDKAKSTGFELVSSWQAPGNYFGINGNLTWQNFRNLADKGYGAPFNGDRVPYVPYFFGNLSARATRPAAIVEQDELSLMYYTRYVHRFYRGWESAGQGLYVGEKDQVPTQVSHALALTYLVRRDKRVYSMSIDAQNLTDAALFDEFGAQRPGRGYYFKLTAEH